MFVKICGLRDEQHVRAAIDAGADAIGFVFAESVRRVDPERAREISSKVPGTVKKVAVMLHPSSEEWQAVLDGFAPDVLQTDADDFARLDVPGSVECWPVYREGNGVGVPGVKVTVPFLYEGQKSGQGETVDWARAAVMATQGRMILAGGLEPENVAEAIAAVKPYGVDVSSGVESAPGQKDPELISKFVIAAKAAEKEL